MSFDKGSSLTDLHLCHSLCYQPGYDTFRSRLKQSLPPPDGPTLPTTDDEAIDAALKVLQTEREREEDHDETDEDQPLTRTRIWSTKQTSYVPRWMR